jgi:hypothetical protein
MAISDRCGVCYRPGKMLCAECAEWLEKAEKEKADADPNPDA